MRFSTVALSISLLVACAPTPPPETAPQPPPPATAPPPPPAATAAPPAPAAACEGKVDSPPPGLEPVNEPPPSFAIGAPGKGALCEGKVFTVKQPITVYRIFTAKFEAEKKAGPVGAYWSFQRPTGTKDAYRVAYDICVEWNDLDTINECKIDVGARVVLGPGQSADCDGGVKYRGSAANQVLIVKGADGKVPVSGCAQKAMTWSK